MRLTANTTAIITFFAGSACAEAQIDTLCGRNHVNEVASAEDVVANPDGYYVRSLGVQLSAGDPRIIEATGEKFNLCTTSAATPDMDAGRALLLMGDRKVRYLFVPLTCPEKDLSS